jgi:hypothetical protein
MLLFKKPASFAFSILVVAMFFYSTVASAVRFDSRNSEWVVINYSDDDSITYRVPMSLLLPGSQVTIQINTAHFVPEDTIVSNPSQDLSPDGIFILPPHSSARITVKSGNISQLEGTELEIIHHTCAIHDETLKKESNIFEASKDSDDEYDAALGDDEGDSATTLGLENLKLDKEPKKSRYKLRLFVGEGAFSYTVAFLLKHPELAGSIVATELDSIEELREKHHAFEENMFFLRSMNVDVRFGIDAMALHEDSGLKKEHFKRIHFNFPYCDHDSGNKKTRRLLENFFMSAGQLQHTGDRIYVVLPKPNNVWDRKRREGVAYAIYSACTRAGYQYIKKRQFGKERYPRYEHVMTRGSGSANVAEDSREYIFEKKEVLLPLREQVEEVIEKLREYNEIIFVLEEQIKTDESSIEKRGKTLKEWVKKRNEEIKKWVGKRTEEQNAKIEEWKRMVSKYNTGTEQLRSNVKEKKEKLQATKSEQVSYVTTSGQEKWLSLARDLASYGLESTPGFQSKIFFSQDVPCITSGLRKIDFQWIKGDSEERNMRLEDSLDFLFSERLVIYHNTYGGVDNSAFYPLPDLTTDEESSSYSSDSDVDIHEENVGLEHQLGTLSLLESRAKKESLTMAQQSGAIGYRSIPHWILQDVEGDGNCLFRAVAHQLQLLQHPFINTVPVGTDVHDILRLRAQGSAFQDRTDADYPDIIALARNLNVIVAIVDTRYPENGFMYHYINQTEHPDFTRDLNTIEIDYMRNRQILRLAFTGNHYLSVIATPSALLEHNHQTLNFLHGFYEGYIEDNRHYDPFIQRAYDSRFGLISSNFF